jgi:hypothetical protein
MTDPQESPDRRLRRLDKSKPPPGWHWYALTGYYKPRHTCGRNERVSTKDLEEAHEWAAEDAQPYIDDALARLVEYFLRGMPQNSEDATDSEQVVIEMVQAIESGEWRDA